jgi:hypothetical protein
VEAFHSTIKGIHLTLEVKTSFRNSTPATGSSTGSSSQKPGVPTDSHHRHHWKRGKKKLAHKELQSKAWATMLSKTDLSWPNGHTSRHAKASSNKDSCLPEWPLEHDRQPPPRHQPPVWPAPTWHPFDRTVTSSSSRVTEPAQKWGVHLLESKLGNSQQSENASNTHTKHAKSRFHWKLSYYTIV